MRQLEDEQSRLASDLASKEEEAVGLRGEQAAVQEELDATQEELESVNAEAVKVREELDAAQEEVSVIMFDGVTHDDTCATTLCASIGVITLWEPTVYCA